MRQNIHESSDADERSETRHILIVDDDILLLNALEEGLSSRGYRCKTAVTSTQALELFSEDSFNIVVTDICLPDLSGFELVHRVKKIKPDATILIMTGLVDDFSYDDAMNAGASDFIKKPFSIRELVARIEHAKRHERLHDLSLRDELTGLYNRRGFFTLSDYLLKTAERQKKGLFMLYSDLDGLKEINDTLGHQKGDRALMDTADVLRETFRSSDIIARIGGDEFVVMLSETTGGNVGIVLHRLKEAIESVNEKEGRDYELSVSIGTAYFDPSSPCTVDELLSQADRCMYDQKKGRPIA